MSSSAPSVPPPSPSWFTRLTRSPGAPVRGPQRRSAYDHSNKKKREAAAAGSGDRLVGPSHSRGRRPLRGGATDEEAGDDDDDDEISGGDAHFGDYAGGTTLSTSSLGRNHRLSFLGLLAPTGTVGTTTQPAQHLVRMSSQPPQRNSGSLLSRGTVVDGGNSRHLPVKPKPFLTLSLVKLNEILPAYCRALVDPTQGSAQACAVLDSSLATATSWSSSSPSASPRGANPRSASRAGDASAPSSGTSPTAAGSLLQWFTPTSASAAHASSSSFRFPSNPLSLSSPPSSNSAMAMEGEWESCTAPFFLLAAAETLYHDMNHCFHRREFEANAAPRQQQQHAPAALGRLYVRIVHDLTQLKGLLCDPFLIKTAGVVAGNDVGEGPTSESAYQSSEESLAPPERPSSVQRSVDAARNLSSTLDALVSICRVRSQLVTVQFQLFASAASFFAAAHGPRAENVSDGGNPTEGSRNRRNATPRTSPSSCLAEASRAVRLLLQSLPLAPLPIPETRNLSDSSSSGLQLLHQSLITECTRWNHCLNAACALDRCQFYDTLLSLRRLKSSLLEETNHPGSRLSLWFRSTYDRMTSLLPVYFDRIQAFSTPLYGYDTSLLLNGKHVDADWNAAVVDVLRRQEKSGPPMAFVLVLDAETAGTTNVQKGLQLAALSIEPGDSRTAWPALYIRSTLHLNSAGPSSSRPTLIHGSSGYLTSSSQGSILQNWSIGGNPSTSAASNVVPSKALLSFSKASVLEYAPESGIASWPHSEWDHLSNILRNQRFEKSEPDTTEGTVPSTFVMNAVTYRDQEEDEVRPSRLSRESPPMRSLDDESSFLSAPTSSDGSPRRRTSVDPTVSEKSTSVFHTCPVSDFLTLVVIVDSEGDDHRWRRKTGLADGEIQETLAELSLHFSVVRSFTVYSIPSNKQDSSIVKGLRYAFKASQAPSALPRKTDAVVPRDHSQLTDECVASLLKDVKVTFGLRPVNPLSQDSLLRSTATLSPASRRFLSQRASSVSSSTSSLLGLRRNKDRAIDDGSERLDSSALNLFVGSDLASLFG